MKNRDKEEYLSEYEQLKKKGKSFFPYAIVKDSVMFLVVKLGTTAPPWVRATRPKGARPSELIPAGVPAVDGAEIALNGHSTNGHVEVSTNGASAPTAGSNGSPEAPENPTEAAADGPDAPEAGGENA